MRTVKAGGAEIRAFNRGDNALRVISVPGLIHLLLAAVVRDGLVDTVLYDVSVPAAELATDDGDGIQRHINEVPRSLGAASIGCGTASLIPPHGSVAKALDSRGRNVSRLSILASLAVRKEKQMVDRKLIRHSCAGVAIWPGRTASRTEIRCTRWQRLPVERLPHRNTEVRPTDAYGAVPVGCPIRRES
jgi:hypothetical protein